MTTPFLPVTPHPPHRVVSPVHPIRPGYTQKSQTLPSRFSPVNTTETGTPTPTHQSNGHPENIRVSTTYTAGLERATPTSRMTPEECSDSLPSMMQASNVYPLHLLFTTNYRLPGDVDRCNLEKHLSDADFDLVFRVSREDFYKLPYWKRCDLKRKYHLF